MPSIEIKAEKIGAQLHIVDGDRKTPIPDVISYKLEHKAGDIATLTLHTYAPGNGPDDGPGVDWTGTPNVTVIANDKELWARAEGLRQSLERAERQRVTLWTRWRMLDSMADWLLKRLHDEDGGASLTPALLKRAAELGRYRAYDPLYGNMTLEEFTRLVEQETGPVVNDVPVIVTDNSE